MKPIVLDLFSGTGGASQAFRGLCEVVTVDNDPSHRPDIVADLSTWSWSGPRPTLIWASPPCTEFTRERLPWLRTGVPPSMDLVLAAKRIIEECQPQWWVVENVRGAVPYLDKVFGRFRARGGPFFLWGNIPPFRVEVPPFKEKLSSARRKERAAVPPQISAKLLQVIYRGTFDV